MEYDLDDAAEFLAAIWDLWFDGSTYRGEFLERADPVIFAAFDHLVNKWSSGKPIRLPDHILPEYLKDPFALTRREKRDGQDIRKWLRPVGRNAIRDQHKAARRRRYNERKAALQVNHYAFAGRVAQSAEGVFMRMEAERELGRAIDSLPPKLRVVAELVYTGYSRKEIAEMLDVNVRTVNRRLESIRSPRVRQLIEDSIETLAESLLLVNHPDIRAAA